MKILVPRNLSPLNALNFSTFLSTQHHEREFVYDFSSLLGISPQETTEYYNPITGVKVVI